MICKNCGELDVPERLCALETEEGTCLLCQFLEKNKLTTHKEQVLWKAIRPLLRQMNDKVRYLERTLELRRHQQVDVMEVLEPFIALVREVKISRMSKKEWK